MELRQGIARLLLGDRPVFGRSIVDGQIVSRPQELATLLTRFIRDPTDFARVASLGSRTQHLAVDQFGGPRGLANLALDLAIDDIVGILLDTGPFGDRVIEEEVPILAAQQFVVTRANPAPPRGVRIPGSLPVAAPTPLPAPHTPLLAFSIGAPLVFGDAVNPAMPVGAKPLTDAAPADMDDRFLEVLSRVPDHLPAELKAEFLAFLTVENAAWTAFGLALWAGAHFVGVGEAIDVLFAAVGYAMVGIIIFSALDRLVDAGSLTYNAKTIKDLDDSAKILAQVISMIGIGALVALLTKAIGKRIPKPRPRPLPPPPKPPTPPPPPPKPPTPPPTPPTPPPTPPKPPPTPPTPPPTPPTPPPTPPTPPPTPPGPKPKPPKPRKPRVPPKKVQPVEVPTRHPRTPKEMEDLTIDPDHAGKVNEPGPVQERNVAIGLENRGDIPGPVTRDMRPGKGDFIDANGKTWDVKGPSSRPPKGTRGEFKAPEQASKVDDSLAKGENVMLDTTDMNADDVKALKAEGASRGWGDKVKWWP